MHQRTERSSVREPVRIYFGLVTRKLRQDAQFSAQRWDVAKLVRHGVLIPAFVGSSPTVPASLLSFVSVSLIRDTWLFAVGSDL